MACNISYDFLPIHGEACLFSLGPVGVYKVRCLYQSILTWFKSMGCPDRWEVCGRHAWSPKFFYATMAPGFFSFRHPLQSCLAESSGQCRMHRHSTSPVAWPPPPVKLSRVPSFFRGLLPCRSPRFCLLSASTILQHEFSIASRYS